MVDLRTARQMLRLDEGLTPRELEVLRCLAAGGTYRSIGKEIFLTQESVRAAAGRATKKLGAKTRTEAVATALRVGLIE